MQFLFTMQLLFAYTTVANDLTPGVSVVCRDRPGETEKSLERPCCLFEDHFHLDDHKQHILQ